MNLTSVRHGFPARIILCDSAASQGTFCERAKYTHELSGNEFSNYTHICYIKELFPNHLCNRFGPRSRRGFEAGVLPDLDSSVPVCPFLARLAIFWILFRDFPHLSLL